MSASAAGAAALGTLPTTLSRALAIAPSRRSLGAVKHVVVLMQENRSFDHYFGALAGVRGFGDAAALRLRDGRSVFAQSGGAAHVLPYRLDATGGAAPCAPDLDHSWDGTHRAWNGGRWDEWIGAKSALTMGHMTRADIPFHYALADAFTVCDHYFCSVMGPTNPNRLYLWSGTIDADGHAGGPVTDNHTTGFRWTTYPERLQAAGVDWRIYQNAADNYDDNALAWFAAFQRAMPGSPLFDRGMASVPAVTGSTADDIVAALRRDVIEGSLPAVSWIIAPERASEHPAWSPANGAHFIDGVLRALTADPEVWASTVLLINYDENDGYFDHVPPPVPPVGTPGEFVRGEPVGLGPRVPMLVVSPWSRGGAVCSETFDHSSVIRFLETWLGVQEPNISAWRRAVCGDLTCAFDFETATFSMPALPKTSAQAGAERCRQTPAQPPREGSMPVQETGARPRRPLPYRPVATIACEHDGLLVRLGNADDATASAHFAVYTGDDAAPRQYDVAPGESIEATFASSGVAVYGPAGFVRRFDLAGEDARAGDPSDRDDSANENAGLKPAFPRSMA
jgi:phospholipase C